MRKSVFEVCEQFIGKYHIYTCIKQNFNILTILCSRGDWFESRFVGNPESRFGQMLGHFCFVTTVSYRSAAGSDMNILILIQTFSHSNGIPDIFC